MASRSSRNKKEAIKERMLQYQERRKNMVSKNIDKYNEFFLVPLELWLIFDSWNKNYNTF